MKKIILFDFDGTIANTMNLVLQEYNSVANKYLAKRVDTNKIKELQEMNIRQVMKIHNLYFWNLPILLIIIKNSINKKSLQIKPFEGVIETIKNLKEEKNECIIGILSANKKSTIESFLERNQVEKEFDFIVSSKGLFNKQKDIERILQKYKLNKSDIIYVCDEVRDISVCNKIGIPSIAVGWGFNSPNALENSNPSFLVTNTFELKQSIEQFLVS
jgi:phosphoglycolate phosphatase